MKKIAFILIAAVFAVHGFAHDAAKQKKTPEEMAGKRADKLKTELGLSDQQRASVYNALLDKINQENTVKQKYKDSSNRKGKGEEIKAIHQSFDTQMSSILTSEQKVKYDALKKEKKDEKEADRENEKVKTNNDKKGKNKT